MKKSNLLLSTDFNEDDNQYWYVYDTQTLDIKTFDTEEEMNAKEAELVTSEFCLREDTYNICVGGLGGFSYINSITRTDPSSEMEQKRVSKMRATLIDKGIRPPAYVWTEERRQRNSETQKRMLANGTKRSYFKESNPMSDPELRSRHKEAVKNNSKGTRNSQHGTMWITDGYQNKKIKSVDVIPESWYKGRVTKVQQQVKGITL